MSAPFSQPTLRPGPRRPPSPWTRSLLRLGLLVLLGAALSGCGGSPWRDTYFKKGVDRLTQDEVREKLGPPHLTKTPVLGGESLWTYRFALSDRDLDRWSPTLLVEASQAASAFMSRGQDAPKPTLYCYRYLLTFNEEKVLTRWKREECVPGTRDQLSAH
jgi:hypothetical protein